MTTREPILIATAIVALATGGCGDSSKKEVGLVDKQSGLRLCMKEVSFSPKKSLSEFAVEASTGYGFVCRSAEDGATILFAIRFVEKCETSKFRLFTQEGRFLPGPGSIEEIAAQCYDTTEALSDPNSNRYADLADFLPPPRSLSDMGEELALWTKVCIKFGDDVDLSTASGLLTDLRWRLGAPIKAYQSEPDFSALWLDNRGWFGMSPAEAVTIALSNYLPSKDVAFSVIPCSSVE